MLTFNTEKEFNDFRFGDLNYNAINKHYFTMNRVSENEDKIVVNVSTPFFKKVLKMLLYMCGLMI